MLKSIANQNNALISAPKNGKHYSTLVGFEAHLPSTALWVRQLAAMRLHIELTTRSVLPRMLVLKHSQNDAPRRAKCNEQVGATFKGYFPRGTRLQSPVKFRSGTTHSTKLVDNNSFEHLLIQSENGWNRIIIYNGYVEN